jgi:hypothetical protein
MDPLLYFTTFLSAAVLIVGSITTVVWVLWKLIQLSIRVCRNAIKPEPTTEQPKQAEFEGWHPAHLKRAGQ